MATRFQYGVAYTQDPKKVRALHGVARVPIVSFEVSSLDDPGFRSVLGLLDTGAVCTVLSLQGATALGIRNPKLGVKRSARTATGRTFYFYEHLVKVRHFRRGDTKAFEHYMPIGIAPKVVGNIFGRDWLEFICFAVDSEAVHFLH